METNKIGAIIVLYCPDWDTTGKAIISLASQVDCLCIVDNTPNANERKRVTSLAKNIAYIPLKENKGIAAAQNTGIHFLSNKGGFDYVAFSDQDSLAPANTIAVLHATFQALEEHGVKVAAVGTRAVNRFTRKPYPTKSKEFAKYPHQTYDTPCDLTECYSVRSSISMISMISLTTIGGFDETLFIDGVDHEWCWRAWHKDQLRTFISEGTQISHSLGEKDRKIAHKEISISSSFRLYYQYRNYLWLCRRSYTPRFWKRKHLFKYMIKAVYYPLIVSPRWQNLKCILSGIKDGLFSNVADCQCYKLN